MEVKHDKYLRKEKDHFYTKKDLKDPIEKSNHNCKGCEYENNCPYKDKSDCFQFNS